MIKAVMFDMGGTLEDLYSDEKNNKATAYALYDILKKHNVDVPYEAEPLWEIVGKGIQEYKKDSERTLVELKPEEIWCDWGFKNIPVNRNKLAEISEEIAHMWETTFYDRKLRDHAAEMLKGLKEDLGMHVSVVSNTGSLFQVFSTLNHYGVRQYFDDITLSSITGYRKPHPNIFRIALAQADLDPSECAFVGDTLSRDVVGPRKMGFGRVFKINSFLTPQKDLGTFDVQPDYQITDIYDVYALLKKERENEAAHA
ncbi:MAG: HAD family hydrolase [Clostridia bacterium]|nr:HAD family hydrolase [Clostridia bacterium]MBR0444131.1 HAD family hydrolase [Clostridia bacterium]